MTSIESGRVRAVASRCGCAGKTPLNRVVRPALAALRDRLETVRIAGDLEAGLLPNTTALERSVLGGGDASGGGTRPPRIVAAAFVGAERGSDAAAFRDVLADAYRRWARVGADRPVIENASDGPEAPADRGATVVKGHSIQLDGATEPAVWGERMVPSGRRRPGYRAVNVDVVHAFPKLEPERQAAVATVHALNDCYTQGATRDRDIRPIVAVPVGTALGCDPVRRWFRAAAPAGVTVREPSIVTHEGRGWQFGASATAVTSRTPPVRRAAIEPGDEVVVHRPPGALALYAGTLDAHVSSELGSSVRERAVEALTTDHIAISRAIAASCPSPEEPFDPDRHLKWVCDLSGPGIGGLVQTLADESYGLHLESVPLLDRAGLDAVRDAWTVPDVTAETNGPLAAIGSSSALERFEERLEALPIADPSRLGRVTEADALRWDGDVGLEGYVERLARQQGP